jgi:hypothetical protein
VWLQLFGVSDCNQELCVVAKINLTLSVWLESYLVVWNMIASLGSKWLQKTKVCHCKICWFISVTAKQKKKNWTNVWLQLFDVIDCNQELCAVAKRNLTLSVWLKSYLVVWNMIASLGSKWLQKTKVCDCKISWFIYVTAKKKKKNWTSVWLQLFGVRDCNQELCVLQRETWLCLCACKATWLFRKWLQAWVVCGCKKLKCVIEKTAGLFLWLQKRKRKTEPLFDCNYLACVIATRSYVCCKKETWLCLCACKATWLFGIWLQAWG